LPRTRSSSVSLCCLLLASVFCWFATELHSYLNGLLYSASVSKEMFVDHSYPRKRVPYRVGFQESTPMERCLSTRSLAMGTHVTIYIFFRFWVLVAHVREISHSIKTSVILTGVFQNVHHFAHTIAPSKFEIGQDRFFHLQFKTKPSSPFTPYVI
jgi:hypothetical protein